MNSPGSPESPVCPACGGAIRRDRDECPHCFTPLKQRASWLSRLLHWFMRPKLRGKLPPLVIEHVQHFDQQVEVVDETTTGGGGGGKRVYNSLADAPPELRRRVEGLLSEESRIGRRISFTFRGADGQERTYHSVDEMPPDVRQMFEQAHQRLQ